MNILHFCCFLLVVFNECFGFSIRVRRSASLGNAGGLGAEMQCALSCGLTHAQSWQRVLGMNSNRPNKLSLDILLRMSAGLDEDKRHNFFTDVCTVYDSFNNCIALCPDDMIKRGISSGLSSLRLLCGPKHEQYIAILPCLSKKDTLIREECQAKSDRLAVTSMQLQSIAVSTIDKETIMQSLRTFCMASVDQSRCAMPAVERACGAEAAGLMRDMLDESLSATRNFLTSSGMQLPIECNIEKAGLPTTMPMQTQIPRPVFPEFETDNRVPGNAEPLAETPAESDIEAIIDRHLQYDNDAYRSSGSSPIQSISLISFLVVLCAIFVH